MGSTVAMAMAIFAFPTFLLVVVGLLPTVIAVLFDQDQEHARVKVMALLNVSGLFPFLDHLWSNGNSATLAVDMISSAYTWMAIYGAAGAAILMLWFAPAIAAIILQINNAHRRNKLAKWRRKMTDEWGDDIVAAANQES